MIFNKQRPFLLVGAGRMGGAMLAGWIKQGVDPASILVSDPQPAPEMAAFLSDKGIGHVTSVPEGLEPAIILVAVKPQLMSKVLPGLKSVVKSDTVILSVAAGTPISVFETAFGQVPVARAMPNTPAMVGRGITAVYPTDRVTKAQKETIDELLAAVGKVVWLDNEDQIDSVTAVSGSGPAYVFWMAECMAEAGKALGLSNEVARALADATVSGAGELMHQSDDTPTTLRQNVTSPNGTTAAALEVLMAEDGLKPLMQKAAEAAQRRARELAAD
ncbi:pyrroline-5-carboxylate reductase [Roseibium sp. CAU 1637]|uniref:Pyrroline-5-carboxylate reductase n=1 Tax=Roseibium limicola TaxID=2816037 RepID=A0A939EM42_9HYPH|nr:pyrroline-5-carboxylate reductase [Roseibium limicola]MBO0343833.1 pyrroline-5-carboxylate reductase [Roseibium limicola]